MEDAVAGYTAAVALLLEPLPAFVSYRLETRARFGVLANEGTENIVVRTHDAAIVGGELPKIEDAPAPKGELLTRPPFVPHCYTPKSAVDAELDGRALLAIRLADRCDQKNDTAFDTLYVDPKTHEPVAATASADEDGVAVSLDERFAPAGDYVLPKSFTVNVRGSGTMDWLKAHVAMTFSDYRFSATQP